VPEIIQNHNTISLCGSLVRLTQFWNLMTMVYCNYSMALQSDFVYSPIKIQHSKHTLFQRLALFPSSGRGGMYD
jgi:hypothetical protein